MRSHKKNDLNMSVVWATILVAILLLGTYPEPKKQPPKVVQPTPAQWKDEAPIPFGVRDNKAPRIERNTHDK